MHVQYTEILITRTLNCNNYISQRLLCDKVAFVPNEDKIPMLYSTKLIYIDSMGKNILHFPSIFIFSSIIAKHRMDHFKSITCFPFLPWMSASMNNVIKISNDKLMLH